MGCSIGGEVEMKNKQMNTGTWWPSCTVLATNTHTHIHVHAHTHTRADTHIYTMCAHIHACVHAHTRADAHTCADTHTEP
jgi:hypothetical protein